ncbi:(2Fe-2S)-binding protein [Streptomyces sp. NBC_00237]|uniref:(2Fe-2S)-binding protein n=1 Tax=Streptomyces sp. NBC_00237 TaxID=2975687 RepID=UPI00224CCC47|nr:(2Fe-2S)-binding protein [Streptomyces sp. NBC_00237]MCX5201748.1 (2Fe-2S)-binding protein [Streptomyces sp. NBC_00237]
MFVCSCFGVTDQQIKAHAADGACTPRQIASVTKAGTDCGNCVRTIQGLLGRGACPRRGLIEKRELLAQDLDAAAVQDDVPALGEAA